MMFLFALLLLNAVQFSSCERFIIVPSPDSPCPGEFTGEPCFTLDEYVADPSLSSNVVLELQPGIHRLDSQLSASNINSFTMRANTSATVMCSQEYYFNRLQQVHVSQVTFVGCRMTLQHITNATFERNSFVNGSTCNNANLNLPLPNGAALNVQYSLVLIRQCIFSNNLGYKSGAIYGNASTLTVEQTTFRKNSICTCCDSGAAIYLRGGSMDIGSSKFIGNSAGYITGLGAAIYASNAIVTVARTYFSDNKAGYNGHGGAIYTSNGVTAIIGTNFIDNSAGGNGGAVYTSSGVVSITRTDFRDNKIGGSGGAIYTESNGVVTITSSFFRDNRAGNDGCGGAVYTSSELVTITSAYFRDNTAGNSSGHGGAVSFDTDSFIITSSTFINNAASAGEGGAIYSARCYTNISLTDNIFSQSTAAFCGVMKVNEFYHYRVNIIGNTFTYNRATQIISKNKGGGVMCIRNASLSIVDNTFCHNSAAGGAGVIQVDESDIIIERSIFSNNRAGANGGVLLTYSYPTRYSIINSSFTNNQAGGDGGVMYIGRADSQVTFSQSTFSFNNARNRGGVVAIIGSFLKLSQASTFENTARLGNVVSACNSHTITENPALPVRWDPIYSFCGLFGNVKSSNKTVSRTTGQTTPPQTFPPIL